MTQRVPSIAMKNGRERIAFVTGKLAAPALRAVVGRLAEEVGFEAQIVVAKISVAALMTPHWLIGKLALPAGTSRMILPGWCTGDLEDLGRALGGVTVECGPKDLRDLPEHFRIPVDKSEDYGSYDIEILAEINNANRLTLNEILEIAERYRSDGADVIDLGGSPGERWREIGSITGELIDRGYRVSVDSFDPSEVSEAATAGAELVLSVDSNNCESAQDWACEVVVVPDQSEPLGEMSSDRWLASLEYSVECLQRAGIRYRLDPVLEPIGFGLAASLGRYLRTREHFPQAAIMMGIGNLTELTAVDSAGVNAVLIGFAQELGIKSVLTTEVINWARSSVKEINVAREMMKYAVDHQCLPKHIDDRLLLLRDENLLEHGPDELHRLWQAITDPNFRIFAEDAAITIMNRGHFEQGRDPQKLFERLGVTDAAHAFYLGYELMKAATALQLGKRYVQDEPLRWGVIGDQ